MKVKTIQTKNLQDFETQLNAFDSNHKVRATQTHVNSVESGGCVDFWYTAVIYYEETRIFGVKE